MPFPQSYNPITERHQICEVQLAFHEAKLTVTNHTFQEMILLHDLARKTDIDHKIFQIEQINWYYAFLFHSFGENIISVKSFVLNCWATDNLE